jgi:hypothetical protein
VVERDVERDIENENEHSDEDEIVVDHCEGNGVFGGSFSSGE